MKYVAAYLMAVLGGNDSPSKANVVSILASVGIEADDSLLSKFLKEMEGKNVDDLISKGMTKLSSMSAAPAGAVAPVAEKAPEKKEKKEEKKEEKEEEDDDLGFNLFD